MASKSRGWAWILPALVAAGLTIGVYVLSDRDRAGIRGYGASTVQALLSKGPQLRPLGSARAQADELVALRYTTQRAYLLVLGLSDAGEARLHYGADARSQPVEAGAGLLLPLKSTQTGPSERLLAVLSDTPVTLEAARAALTNARPESLPGEVFTWRLER